MSGNLQVTDIQTTDVGIEIQVAGVHKVLKIASRGQILIRHKVVTTEELKIGDEILAYGFDVVPEGCKVPQKNKKKTTPKKTTPKLSYRRDPKHENKHEKNVDIIPSEQYNKGERRRECVRIQVNKEIK